MYYYTLMNHYTHYWYVYYELNRHLRFFFCAAFIKLFSQYNILIENVDGNTTQYKGSTKSEAKQTSN